MPHCASTARPHHAEKSRFKDQVRVFRVDPGPFFTQIAEAPTGFTELERANPRDLDLSADGRTLYVANTLGHTIAAIDVSNDANTLIKNLPVGGLSTDVKIAGRWGIVSGQAPQDVGTPQNFSSRNTKPCAPSGIACRAGCITDSHTRFVKSCLRLIRHYFSPGSAGLTSVSLERISVEAKTTCRLRFQSRLQTAVVQSRMTAWDHCSSVWTVR